MSWPTSPTNGQRTTVAGIVYEYDSGNVAWNRVFSGGYQTLATVQTVSNAAQPNITSVGTMSNLTVTGNVSAGNFIGNGSSLTSITGANVTGTVSLATSATSATTAGTVTANAQPNITSLGTLSSVTVTGLVTATSGGVKVGNIQDTSGTNTITLTSGSISVVGNITAGSGGTGNVNATYFVGSGQYLTSLAGSNISGQVSNALVSGTVYSNAQPNITSVGSLASLTMAGTLTAKELTEIVATPSGNTYDFSNGGVFYTSPSVNFTPNFTNIPTTDNRITVVGIILNQGVTPYMPTADSSNIQINSSNVTVKWSSGSVPTGHASSLQVVSYSLLRMSSTWYVSGTSTAYY